MDAGERSSLATLAYYGALRWPLTAMELVRFGIPPARLGEPARHHSLDEVFAVTERLTADGRIRAEGGLFTLTDVPGELVGHRVLCESVNADKWRRMLSYARRLRFVPYIRMLAASGSLAMGSTGESSDWDILAVVKARRIYTARLGMLAVAACMGRLRTKRMRTASDRFCFNHILTTDGLSLRHRSLFTAHALAWLVPFYDPLGHAGKLREANHWMTAYVNGSRSEHFERRTLPTSRLTTLVRGALEVVLDTFVGTLIERLVKRWMQRRIAADSATHEKGGRVVADDREIEFHPHSFEAVALARYNATLTHLGLGQYTEHDSGLTH